MYKIYIFPIDRKQTIASLKYTETFETKEEAENRIAQFGSTNYIIAPLDNLPILPLVANE